MKCPTCGSEDKGIRKLVYDDSMCEYGGPTIWDPCIDEWHPLDKSRDSAYTINRILIHRERGSAKQHSI
jgi:hypothetical protein